MNSALADLHTGTEYVDLCQGPEGVVPIASRDARILILGTGLPTAEAVLGLISRGHRGKITALSMQGRLPELPPVLASQLHEIVAWHRLELKAGRVLSARRLLKRQKLRGIRVEYFSEELGTPAKLEVDLVLNCEA